MADWRAVEADLEALLEAEGYELVELQKVTGRGARLTLLVDRADGAGHITLDECATVSQKVSQYLDVADPFSGPFQLMVSSPGVDRPLNKLEHCRRAVGQAVRVKYRTDGGTNTVQGKLADVEGEALAVEVDGERTVVPWPQVVKANVVYDWGD